mmetsp:Transcript_22766/g.76476  ORF Transcript_22766/g.76476 Transcript_22766/m.76476 type:complete len:278 (-) Transcript_22766:102-935(-)
MHETGGGTVSRTAAAPSAAPRAPLQVLRDGQHVEVAQEGDGEDRGAHEAALDAHGHQVVVLHRPSLPGDHGLDGLGGDDGRERERGSKADRARGAQGFQGGLPGDREDQHVGAGDGCRAQGDEGRGPERGAVHEGWEGAAQHGPHEVADEDGVGNNHKPGEKHEDDGQEHRHAAPEELAHHVLVRGGADADAVGDHQPQGEAVHKAERDQQHRASEEASLVHAVRQAQDAAAHHGGDQRVDGGLDPALAVASAHAQRVRLKERRVSGHAGLRILCGH